MKARVGNSGLSLLDEQVKDAQDTLAYGFYDDVAYAKNVFFWIPGETPQKGEHIDIKLYDKKYSGANGFSQKFLTKHSTPIEVGDYVYDESDSSYWICTEAFNIANIHYEGRLTLCNWFLRWQRSDGTILEYPCQDMNATQYNSGESGNKYMTLGSSQHVEIVQATEDTLALASPQRFYIDRGNKIPYVVTQNDSTTYNCGKGICLITVMQDVNREGVDRPDLGICDYISPALPEDDDETTVLNGEIVGEIQGNKTLKIGFERTYKAILTNKFGEPIVWTDDFYWNVYPASKVKLNIEDDKLYVLAEDEGLIGQSISVEIRYRGAFVCGETIAITEAF